MRDGPIGAPSPGEVFMECNELKVNGVSVLEIDDAGFVINSTQDLLDIVSDYSVKKIVLKRENINPDFFDLRTGFAGEILQKASNYKLHIGFIGSFDDIESTSMRDFIYESNRTKQIVFKSSLKEILRIFCR